MAHSESLWLDSDVILDWLAARQPWDAAATEIIERAVLGHWVIWFSPLTLANIHYVYRKQAGAAKAMDAIRSLAEIGNIASIESNHVLQAITSGKSDFEDGIQIASASSLPDLAAIITRNLRDYSHSPVPPMTAQTWLLQRPVPLAE